MDDTYLNFDLLIEASDARDSEGHLLYRARVLNSPAGHALQSFSLAFSEAEVQRFLGLVHGYEVSSGEGLTPKAFGERLFAALFAGAVGHCWSRSVDVAEGRGVGLRLRLRLHEVPELVKWPWEYLHDPEREHFLALSKKTPIVRYIETAGVEQPLEVARPLRILMVIANPQDAPDFSVNEQWEKIRRALGGLLIHQLVEIELLSRPTLSHLQNKLRQREYHVLHFIGYGVGAAPGMLDSSAARLLFERKDHYAELVSSTTLSTVLRDHRSLRLVVFNCGNLGIGQGKEQVFAHIGQSLVQHQVPCVITMPFPLSKKATFLLYHGFYHALAHGLPVDLALARARQATFMQKLPEWGAAQLFMRTANGHLFELEGDDEEGPAPGEPPFKGLQHFEEREADHFFGREKVTKELVARLHALLEQQAAHFLAVIGASGSGKSSIVRAGLLPALKQSDVTNRRDWQVHVITPTDQPLEMLASTLTRHSKSVAATETLIQELKENPRTLHLYARRLTHSAGASSPRPHAPTPPLIIIEDGSPSTTLPHSPSPTSPRAHSRSLLLVVDQFEELFTLCHDEQEREAFVANLMEAAIAKGPVMIIIVLRSDFYTDGGQFDRLRELLAKQQEFIGPMNQDELRQAIEKPAHQDGWEFEAGLVDQLLKEVGHEPGALPLLSHALLETWNRRRGRMLTLASYIESGGLHGAIAHTAEQIYRQRFTPLQQAFSQSIFLRLTELGDIHTRRHVKINALLRNDPSQDREVELVLRILANARLITIDEDTVEVAHEALIREWPTLHNWLEENKEWLRIHRHLTEASEQWQRLEKDTDLLYRGARLVQALEIAKSHADELNPLEHRFLKASEAFAKRKEVEREKQQQRELAQARALAREQTRARQRLRVFVIGLTVAFFVALFLLVWAISQRNDAFEARSTAEMARQDAERQSGISKVQSLVAQTYLILTQNHDTELATLLAIEAQDHDIDGDQKAIHRSLRETLSSPYFNVSLHGQYTQLRSVAFTPDGQQVASGGANGTIRLWDVNNPSQTKLVLRGHQDIVAALAFNPHPSNWTLASASDDSTVRLWHLPDDAHKTEEIKIEKEMDVPSLVLQGHSGWVGSVAFNPNPQGWTLASAGQDESIRLWRVDQNSLIASTVLTDTGGWVATTAFSPDGQTLASAGQDGQVRLWDISKSTEIKTIAVLNGHEAWVGSVAFSPDGRLLASGSADQSVRVWNLSDLDKNKENNNPNNNQEPLVLTGHHDQVLSVAFAPQAEGELLASASKDQTIRLWNISPPPSLTPAGANSEQGTLDSEANAAITNAEEPIVLTGHADRIKSIAFRPNSNELMLASASDDQTIRLWDLSQAPKTPMILDDHSDKVFSVAFRPNTNELMLASAGLDKTIRLWSQADDGSGRFVTTAISNDHTDFIRSVTFSPDGHLLASASMDQSVRLWDLRLPIGKASFVLTGHQGQVWSVAFGKHPNGMMLASASDDHTIRLWDVSDSNFYSTVLNDAQNWYTSVAFAPNGQQLAAGSGNGTLALWDLSVAEVAQNPPLAVNNLSAWQIPPPIYLSGHEGSIWSVAFSPDGNLIASASDDQTIRLWDRHQLDAPPTILSGHTGRIRFVTFSADGQTLASTSDDRTIRLWSLDDLTAPPIVLQSHTDWVRSVTSSADGQLLASASDDGTIRIWLPQLEQLISVGCQQVRRNLTWAEWQRYLGHTIPYQRTCDQWAVHPSFIESARDLARKGEIEGAIARLQDALALDPTLQTKINPQADVERYAKANTLLNEGRSLAKNGDLSDALLKFEEALTLDPTLELEPETELKELAASLVQAGLELTQQGEVEPALDKFTKAQALNPAMQIHADTWHSLCQQSNKNDLASKMLIACNQAIAQDPTNGEFRASRGVIRSLVGDEEGAIADFEFYVQWLQGE